MRRGVRLRTLPAEWERGEEARVAASGSERSYRDGAAREECARHRAARLLPKRTGEGEKKRVAASSSPPIRWGGRAGVSRPAVRPEHM